MSIAYNKITSSQDFVTLALYSQYQKNVNHDHINLFLYTKFLQKEPLWCPLDWNKFSNQIKRGNLTAALYTCGKLPSLHILLINDLARNEICCHGNGYPHYLAPQNVWWVWWSDSPAQFIPTRTACLAQVLSNIATKTMQSGQNPGSRNQLVPNTIT